MRGGTEFKQAPRGASGGSQASSQRVRGRDQDRRHRALGWLAALVCLLVLGPALLAPAASADIGDYRCTDPGRVYHGNPRLIRRPAVVSADRVYARIDEYQAILREGLTDRDVRYHFLMKEASKKFARAIKAMARAERHDFVAEQGAILVVREDAPRPPDRTSEVIDKLSS